MAPDRAGQPKKKLAVDERLDSNDNVNLICTAVTVCLLANSVCHLLARRGVSTVGKSVELYPKKKNYVILSAINCKQYETYSPACIIVFMIFRLILNYIEF